MQNWKAQELRASTEMRISDNVQISRKYASKQKHFCYYYLIRVSYIMLTGNIVLQKKFLYRRPKTQNNVTDTLTR